jgi:DNA-binding response OmpR family regulator
LATGPLSQREKKKKILFVDDEPDMTTMLKMALERAGFTIDTFNDPLLALKRFKPNLYDLIILDVIMEKMNGFELCNQLRKVDPLVKVCFLTASGEAYRTELEHCEADKDAFLDMPLPLEEIISEVKKRIGSL